LDSLPQHEIHISHNQTTNDYEIPKSNSKVKDKGPGYLSISSHVWKAIVENELMLPILNILL